MPPSTKPAINQGPCPAGETSRTRLGPRELGSPRPERQRRQAPETQAQGPRGAPMQCIDPTAQRRLIARMGHRAKAQSPLPRRTTKERTEPEGPRYSKGAPPPSTPGTGRCTHEHRRQHRAEHFQPLAHPKGSGPAEGVERGQEARGEQRRQQNEGSHRQQRCRRPQKQQEEAVRTAQINQQAEHRERQEPKADEVEPSRQSPEGTALLEGARHRAVEQQRPHSRHEQRAGAGAAKTGTAPTDVPSIRTSSSADSYFLRLNAQASSSKRMPKRSA